MSFRPAPVAAAQRICGGVFDEAVAEVDRVRRSVRVGGRAYADLAEIASQLATAVERSDRAERAAVAPRNPALGLGLISCPKPHRT